MKLHCNDSLVAFVIGNKLNNHPHKSRCPKSMCLLTLLGGTCTNQHNWNLKTTCEHTNCAETKGVEIKMKMKKIVRNTTMIPGTGREYLVPGRDEDENEEMEMEKNSTHFVIKNITFK